MDALASSKLSDGIDAPLWMFWKRRRYVVVVMAFLGFMNLYLTRVNLSVAIVAMTENRTVVGEDGSVAFERDFDWSSSVQGYVLSSFFYGYLVTQIPGGMLAARLGATNMFGTGVAGTSILALLTPLASYGGAGWVIAIRVLQGMFQGVSFPVMHEVFAKWAPPCERSRMVMLSFAGIYVGTIVSNLVSGILAEALSWESIFYVFGAAGCLWYIAWAVMIRRTPQEDRFITVKEKEFIMQSLGNTEGPAEKAKHPWKSILSSSAVIACVTANFCNNWGFYNMLTLLPTFLKDALHFETQSSGIIAALPYLTMSIMLGVAGYLADWFQIKGIMTTTQVRRNFNCLSFISQAVFLTTGAILLDTIPTIICITIAITMGAFALTGYAVNHLDLSPKSAGVMMGLSNSFGTAAGIGSPILTGYLTPNKTGEEWKMVFYVASAIHMVGFVVYWFWASGELQPWSIEMQERRTRERKGYENKASVED
ncbi:hypothetical protein quinque_002729 [Culex quinquefasciatus]